MRLGHIDLSFHAAAAREVRLVLNRYGYHVVSSTAHHEEMFRRLGDGEVDLLCAAWLPASHQVYLEPIKDRVTALTVLYEPYCIWGVPEYATVDTVNDLLNPEVLDKMERRIQGINPGAGISRFSRAIVKAYGLDEAGYHFETGTEAECFGRFVEAVEQERWIVTPLWHPQWLHNRYTIRALKEPRGLLGGQDKATLLVTNDALGRMAADAVNALRALHLGNARVSALDDEIQRAR